MLWEVSKLNNTSLSFRRFACSLFRVLLGSNRRLPRQAESLRARGLLFSIISLKNTNTGQCRKPSWTPAQMSRQPPTEPRCEKGSTQREIQDTGQAYRNEKGDKQGFFKCIRSSFTVEWEKGPADKERGKDWSTQHFISPWFAPVKLCSLVSHFLKATKRPCRRAVQPTAGDGTGTAATITRQGGSDPHHGQPQQLLARTM